MHERDFDPVARRGYRRTHSGQSPADNTQIDIVKSFLQISHFVLPFLFQVFSGF
jgi:hypothetical protein